MEELCETYETGEDFSEDYYENGERWGWFY